MSWGYKIPKGRISLLEQKQRNQKAMDTYADLAEKPRVSFDLPEPPAKRAPPQPSGRPLEKDVQKAILSMLRWRKDVVFFGRFNRGAASFYNARGEKQFVVFNTVPGFSDIHGMLNNGRAFYIEVKRDAKEKPSSDQEDFIGKIVAGGGIAGVAWTVEQAQSLLDQAHCEINP